MYTSTLQIVAYKCIDIFDAFVTHIYYVFTALTTSLKLHDLEVLD